MLCQMIFMGIVSPMIHSLFQMNSYEFNNLASLAGLYNYVLKCSDQLMLTLEEDDVSTKNHLAFRLGQVHSIMPKDKK